MPEPKLAFCGERSDELRLRFIALGICPVSRSDRPPPRDFAQAISFRREGTAPQPGLAWFFQSRAPAIGGAAEPFDGASTARLKSQFCARNNRLLRPARRIAMHVLLSTFQLSAVPVNYSGDGSAPISAFALLYRKIDLGPNAHRHAWAVGTM